MRFRFSFVLATLILGLAGPASFASAAQTSSHTLLASASALPDAPVPEGWSSSGTQNQPNSTQKDQQPSSPTAPDLNRKSKETPAGVPTTQKAEPLPQPKRILGVMPNYRAVSAGVLPPPPTPREAFAVATQDSFDYSDFVFVGVTSLLAEGTNTHPTFGKGIGGFWPYYWRGFVDRTDGDYWVIWIMPTIVHEDERYYAMGQGPLLKRSIYAASRVLITPNYHGKNTFNAAEIFGRGISQAISLTYYPGSETSFSPFMQKFGYAVGRDALANVFREVWPDVEAKVVHHHHHSKSPQD